MYASAEQLTVRQCRTARSSRFLLRLGILFAAFAAAFVIGTVAAQADTEDPAETTPAETAPAETAPAETAPEEAPAETAPADSPKDDGTVEDDGKNPSEEDQPSLTDLTGAAAVVPEAADDTAEAAEETPALGGATPFVDAAAYTLRQAIATSDVVVGNVEDGGAETVENAADALSQNEPPEQLPEDLQDTAHAALAPLLGMVPGSDGPADHGPAVPGLPAGHDVVPAHSDADDAADTQAAALPTSSAPLADQDGALAARTAAALSPAPAAPADLAASNSSDLGGDTPLNQLLGGGHGVVTGGSGAGVADRATPASASYGDRTELVSDPVRSDARPHTAPVARPEFAPD